MWICITFAFMAAVALMLAISNWRMYSRGDAVVWLFIAILSGWGSYSHYADSSSALLTDVFVERLKTEEGFRAKPYPDTRGFLTIGYGTNLAEGITKQEAETLLRSRLETAQATLRADWPPYDAQPENVKEALCDAAYVLGPHGVQEFKRMLAALEAGDYSRAAAEMLNSDFAKEDPSRAKRIAERINGSR